MTIISPSARGLVVDLGRAGHRHLGVPLGGAADRLSLQLGNWLVGNPPGAGAVEAALGGLEVEVSRDTIIAVTGADAQLSVDGRAVPMWTPHPVSKGARVSIGKVSAGARNYLCMAGGVEGERHFGSVATYPAAGLGANGGRALAAGDSLSLGEVSGAPNTLAAGFRPRMSNHVTLRVRSVTEYDHLDAHAQRRLFRAPWKAGRATSRMGARLEGGTLALVEGAAPMVSSPLMPGTVQVTPSGEPILSLVDGHCTGGYARAVQVIAPDMWLAGQVGPGTRVSFHRAFAQQVPEIHAAHLALWGSLVEGYGL